MRQIPITDAVNAANQAAPPVPKTSETVSKAVAEWREHAAVTFKPSTRRSTESHLRRHILPMLSDCPMADLTARKWGYKVPEVSLSDLSLPRKLKTAVLHGRRDGTHHFVSR